ncbi:MAG: GLPGLI family protein [Chitinophagaceae bacterium]|nr:GLPGLI family protein [Chitinophagaceae bacterium]
MINYSFPVIITLISLVATPGMAQNNQPLKQGRIEYEQIIKGGKRTVSINGQPQTFDMPDRTLKWELLFTADQTLRRAMETEDRPEAEMAAPAAGATGANVRFVSASFGESITWHNFTRGIKVEQLEEAGKKYLVTDSIRKNTWKLTGETKTILGYTCQKAISQTQVKSFNMQMQDGEFKRTEKLDTVNVTAWFAPAIPVPGGPETQGELPGMVLEIESRNGMSTIRAVKISPEVRTADIKEPKTGKKVTKEEYTKEVESGMKEMMNRMRSTRGASF